MKLSFDIGQKQSTVIEFPILEEKRSINMYKNACKTTPSQSPNHNHIFTQKVALPNINEYLKQRNVIQDKGNHKTLNIHDEFAVKT